MSAIKSRPNDASSEPESARNANEKLFSVGAPLRKLRQELSRRDLRIACSSGRIHYSCIRRKRSDSTSERVFDVSIAIEYVDQEALWLALMSVV